MVAYRTFLADKTMRTNQTCLSLFFVLAPSVLITVLSSSSGADSAATALAANLISPPPATTSAAAAFQPTEQHHHDNNARDDNDPSLRSNDVCRSSSSREESATALDVGIMDAANSGSSTTSGKDPGGMAGSTSSTSSVSSLSGGQLANEETAVPARYVVGCNGDEQEAARRSVNLRPTERRYSAYLSVANNDGGVGMD